MPESSCLSYVFINPRQIELENVSVTQVWKLRSVW